MEVRMLEGFKKWKFVARKEPGYPREVSGDEASGRSVPKLLLV
jgi:hypothetical protein